MKIRLAIALAATILSGPPSAGAADNRASTLRVVFDQDINVVDPIATTAYATRALAYLVFDTLVSMDSKGQYKPQMLESWKISDCSSSGNLRLIRCLEKRGSGSSVVRV